MIAYVEHGGTPNGPSDFLYHPVNDPSRNVHPVILAVMTFIGDGFMVSVPAISGHPVHSNMQCAVFGDVSYLCCLEAEIGLSGSALPPPRWRSRYVPMFQLRAVLNAIHALTVAAAFTAKTLLHGPRAYYSILAPSASSELIAYFSMTLLTNIVTTREYCATLCYCFSRVIYV